MKSVRNTIPTTATDDKAAFSPCISAICLPVSSAATAAPEKNNWCSVDNYFIMIFNLIIIVLTIPRGIYPASLL